MLVGGVSLLVRVVVCDSGCVVRYNIVFAFRGWGWGQLSFIYICRGVSQLEGTC